MHSIAAACLNVANSRAESITLTRSVEYTYVAVLSVLNDRISQSILCGCPFSGGSYLWSPYV